ncbi:MAG: DNA polymerase III subunit delta' [Actinomycetota bacterium]|nr:DNA polymerase III subunit delta' [Actinomycetota bacterium]
MTDVVAVFDDVVGQDGAMEQLRAASRAPVHAYLFVGPPGSGKRRAAVAFAAALLCPSGGCGACDVCLRVRAGSHPDTVVVERQGPFITVAQAREIQRLALRSPNEGARKVLILNDFHLVREAGSTLLKVVEEPPESTVFVILADAVPPELVTIASRCVRIDFGSLVHDDLVAALVAEGVDPLVAAEVGPSAGGRLDRARRLASDPGFSERRDSWRAAPARLDGTGATVVVVAAELTDLVARAAQSAVESAAADESGTKKELAERQRRELRRLRMDELRLGLAALGGAYREALVCGAADAGAYVVAIDAVQAAAEALPRNPNETLLLQALLLRLPPLRNPTRR